MATADKLELLKATKANLKAALTEQGQTPGDVLSDYPDLVRAIQTSVTPSISVSSAGLITATAGDKSATKQLNTQSGRVMMPSVSEQLAVETGVYTTGPIYVQGDASLLPENIKSGVSIFGVNGTASGGYKELTFWGTDTFSSSSLADGTLTIKIPLASYCVPRALCFENLWFGATSGASTARYRYKFSGTVRFDSALYAYAFLMMTVATTETGVQSDDCTVAWSHDGTDLVITITDTEGTMFGAVSSGYDNITKISGLLFYKV